MKYARGTNAWARCQRCGDRVKYIDLVADGDVPGLRVCPGCRDIAHPSERPFRTDEGIVLKRPSPDTDDDSPGDSGQTLAQAMGFTNTFGGAT